MRLDNQEIYNFLFEQGVRSLHHANTLATSLTFIQNGGLLSRGAVEDRGLFQTRQQSDNEDKMYGVWHDIFFDSKDLHGHFPRQNLYGPILFKFNLQVILSPDLDISITKNNPMFWNAETRDTDKYFLNMKDVRENWDRYDLQRKMITLRFQKNILPFDHLENIIVDDPNVTIYEDTILHNESLNALNNEINKNKNLIGKVSVRTCTRCYCQSNYLRDYGALKLAKAFLPNSHPRFSNS